MRPTEHTEDTEKCLKLWRASGAVYRGLKEIGAERRLDFRHFRHPLWFNPDNRGLRLLKYLTIIL